MSYFTRAQELPAERGNLQILDGSLIDVNTRSTASSLFLAHGEYELSGDAATEENGGGQGSGRSACC